MREVEGDLWAYPADVYVITTNGFVKRDGRAVMGRGTAAQARDRFPGIDFTLGQHLFHTGNHVSVIYYQPLVIAMPVKHHWSEPADPFLIMRSLIELNDFFRDDLASTIAMPRPGCGNGGLDWEDIRPLCKFLDDRFVVVFGPRKQPRDIVAGHNGELDLVVLQRRILAGAEMKTAIKGFLVWHEASRPIGPTEQLAWLKQRNRLREAMEGWCNAG